MLRAPPRKRETANINKANHNGQKYEKQNRLLFDGVQSKLLKERCVAQAGKEKDKRQIHLFQKKQCLLCICIAESDAKLRSGIDWIVCLAD